MPAFAGMTGFPKVTFRRQRQSGRILCSSFQRRLESSLSRRARPQTGCQPSLAWRAIQV